MVSSVSNAISFQIIWKKINKTESILKQVAGDLTVKGFLVFYESYGFVYDDMARQIVLTNVWRCPWKGRIVYIFDLGFRDRIHLAEAFGVNLMIWIIGFGCGSVVIESIAKNEILIIYKMLEIINYSKQIFNELS